MNGTGRPAHSALGRDSPGVSVELLAAVFVWALEVPHSILLNDWLGAVVSVVPCVGLAAAGRWPRASTVAILCGMVAIAALPFPGVAASLYVPLLGVAGNVARRRTTLAAVLLATGLPFSLWLSRRASGVGEWATTIVLWGLLYAGAWGAGAVLRVVDSERERRWEQRWEMQRREIAMELHDSVAHHLSQMVLRAERARLHPADAPGELEVIAATGRQANASLRNLMSLLRLDQEFPTIAMEDVLDAARGELAAASREASIVVDGDLARLPAPTSDTLGRITREAVNNMVRHAAPDSPCAIVVKVGDERVDAAFLNGWNGRSGSGMGLAGIQDRVLAAGGRFRIGPEGSRWTVRVTLPYGAGDVASSSR